MQTTLSTSAKVLKQSEFEMTHEQIGVIYSLAAELGEPMFSTAMGYLKLYHTKEDAQCFIEEMEDILNCEDK